MRELKAHLVCGADDRVRSGRDGKHFFYVCVVSACLWVKVRIFFLLFASFFLRASDRAYDG